MDPREPARRLEAADDRLERWHYVRVAVIIAAFALLVTSLT